MQVNIHKERCIGAGACKEASPSVFDLDEDGCVVLLNECVGSDLEDSVEEAADNCPGGVIEIAD